MNFPKKTWTVAVQGNLDGSQRGWVIGPRGHVEVGVEDARLLDAARDLLDALKLARNGLAWYQDMAPTEVRECDLVVMKEIDSAIAKATGAVA